MRNRRLVLAGGIAAALLAAYAAAGFWLVPPLARDRLETLVAEKLQLRLEMARLSFNPFTFRARIDEARFVRPDGSVAPLVERLSVHVSPLRFLGGALSLSGLEATLPGGAGTVRGSLGLEPLAGAFSIDATGVPLAPYEPWLREHALLHLRSGSAAARGELKITPEGVEYRGSAALRGVRLDHDGSTEPFVAWKSVETGSVLLHSKPLTVDIEELVASGFVGALRIAEDRSINLREVLVRKDKPAAVAEPPAISVARLKVESAELDFEDRSLRPQFGTRIHQLSGSVEGLSTRRDTASRIALDGRVEPNGTARIRGEMNLLAPTALADVQLAFRNVDMAALTPYTIRFAGYRIASGKLSANLRYQLRDSRLEGNNQLAFDSLVLGERVESPDALDLPLELAVALLTDANGRIELGVPVRGDLRDPQFNYGALVARAIGNVINRVVTAPFRMLGLAGNEKRVNAVSFEPGSAQLAPAEQERLRTLAKGLAARPQLALGVEPGYDPQADAAALRKVGRGEGAPSEAALERLGKARAEAISTALQEYGVDQKRIAPSAAHPAQRESAGVPSKLTLQPARK